MHTAKDEDLEREEDLKGRKFSIRMLGCIKWPHRATVPPPFSLFKRFMITISFTMFVVVVMATGTFSSTFLKLLTLNCHLVNALHKINANANAAWKCAGRDSYNVFNYECKGSINETW